MTNKNTVLDSKYILEIKDFANLSLKKNYQILDTRNIEEYSKSHIPNSICVPFNITFPKFINSVLSKQKNILIICDEKMEKSIYEFLNIIGYHKTIGFLKNGYPNWENSLYKTDFVRSVNPEFILENFENLNTQEENKENHINNFLIDIRNKDELAEGVIDKSLMINMNNFIINNNLLNKNHSYFITCRSGVRSVILYGFLKNNGYDVKNVLKGFNGMSKLGLRIIKPLIR